jgi:hypothetical protein
MAMTFIKSATDGADVKSLRYWLHRHLGGPQPARSLQRVHASALTKPEGMCPRYYALMDVTKSKPKPEWLSTSENITFTLGRWMQDQIVEWFADMDKAICHWKCVSCGNTHEFTLRPLHCKTCGEKNFKPIEVRFESAVTGASCGVDMLVSMGEPKLRPVEIKTIRPEDFKGLVAPLAEHKLRTNLYLRIIEESGNKNVATDRATVLYVTKGGYGCADDTLKGVGINDRFSPFKEFTVKRNDADTERVSSRAQVVKQFREGKVGMPHGICPTAMSKRAFSCSMKDVCFSGSQPPVYDWKESVL